MTIIKTTKENRRNAGIITAFGKIEFNEKLEAEVEFDEERLGFLLKADDSLSLVEIDEDELEDEDEDEDEEVSDEKETKEDPFSRDQLKKLNYKELVELMSTIEVSKEEAEKLKKATKSGLSNFIYTKTH